MSSRKEEGLKGMAAVAKKYNLSLNNIPSINRFLIRNRMKFSLYIVDKMQYIFYFILKILLSPTYLSYIDI